jgi:hypothetical protein
LISTELPAEVLTKIAAEVNRPIEVEHQVSGLGSQNARAQLAKRGDLPVMNQAVHQAVRRTRRCSSGCHNINLGRIRLRDCKT